MTWQGKRRKQLPSNWGALRKARLEYDGYRCTATISWMHNPTTQFNERCPNKATDVHHARHPADHRIEALASLCAYHHNLETQAEAQAARTEALASRPRLRPQPKHPGLA